MSCGRAGHGGQELPGHPEPGWGAAGATSPGGNPRTCQVGVSGGEMPRKNLYAQDLLSTKGWERHFRRRCSCYGFLALDLKVPSEGK